MIDRKETVTQTHEWAVLLPDGRTQPVRSDGDPHVIAEDMTKRGQAMGVPDYQAAPVRRVVTTVTSVTTTTTAWKVTR